MMQRRFAWLVIAWTAPALAAGVLGWSGIWGSGSALVDYLIPIPVAGGVLHLPSFIVTTALVWPMRAGSARIAGAGSAPWLLGAAAVGLLMMLDTERLLRAIVSGALFLPQYDVNVEDLAIVFTNNYFKAEMVDTSDPVATLCLYEDGTASRYGAGLLDCFEHRSFTDRLRAHEFDLASHCPGVEQLADKRQSWNMEEQRVCRDWMRKHSEQVPE